MSPAPAPAREAVRTIRRKHLTGKSAGQSMFNPRPKVVGPLIRATQLPTQEVTVFAGKSLADIQAVLDATPEARWDVTTQAVVATLTERIGRDNARPSSVKRAQAALDLLMSEGRVLKVKPVRTESAPASVPAPESSPLPVAISIPRPGSAPAATVPAAPKPAPKPAARTSGSQKAAQDIITIGKAHGKSIPRWLSAVAAGRPVK